MNKTAKPTSGSSRSSRPCFSRCTDCTSGTGGASSTCIHTDEARCYSLRKPYCLRQITLLHIRHKTGVVRQYSSDDNSKFSALNECVFSSHILSFTKTVTNCCGKQMKLFVRCEAMFVSQTRIPDRLSANDTLMRTT